MSIGTSAWLWMLAAAAIPVLIHLWSRKSGTPKMLPTFRFLPEESIARASRIELHEKGLLLLRILLIILISLLLAGLFFDSEPDVITSVKITESNTEETESIETGNVLELRVPSGRIDRLGWFRLLEHVDYEHSLGLIVIEGRLTADRFTGQLPELGADVQWIAADLQDEVRNGPWPGINNSVNYHIQRRSEMLTETTIEPSDSSGAANETQILRLTVNSGANSSERAGFERTAALWKVELTEADLPSNRLADVQYGDNMIRLNRAGFQTTLQSYITAGKEFGVQLPVTLQESALSQRDNNRSQFDIITESENGDFELTVVPEKHYAEWFYTGVAHQLLKKAMGIEKTLEPEISASQRVPVESDQSLRAGWVNPASATPFLLFLLLLVWAAERVLSKRRGM